MDEARLRETCEKAGQGHLFQFWDQLDKGQQEDLMKDIAGVDLQKVTEHLKLATLALNTRTGTFAGRVEPLNAELLGSTKKVPEVVENYRQLGLTAIGNNSVAALLMAGGQGSRLGVDYPKGMYNVGLPSGKTLYQLQAERILKLQRWAENVRGKACHIPWYIMTSRHTREVTAKFLADHNYFGLTENNVLIFEQMSWPCFDKQGRILLESKSRLAFAPVGNGDLYRTMREEGVLDDMVARGIRHVHAYHVDNILIRVADPAFVGFCVSKELAVAGKVVEKTVPHEPLSVVCKADGTFRILHYHEISREVAELRDPDGRLSLRAGIVGDLIYTTDLLKYLCQPDVESGLEYHLAKKAVPCTDQTGELQHPTSPNAIKLEKFLFNDTQFPQKVGLWEVVREHEFSPLKNSDNHLIHTPTSCRRDVIDLHRRFVLAAGGNFRQSRGASCLNEVSPNSVNEGENTVNVICEISPLVSYAGEGLEDLVKGKKFDSPAVFELAPDTTDKVILQRDSQSQLPL